MSHFDNIIKFTDDKLHKIWHYDLIIVSGNHIKVGNIVFASILFLIGVRYFTKFSNMVQRYIRNKFNIDKDSANALEKIVTYVALSVFVVTILEIANVPLSTFAFIGGALAIGIGFGAQSLISNFISSIVIMIERPLKIGDIIEIDGVMGTVTSVGARCIVLTTFANINLLVPNSKLMQNPLVNWTLNDNAVRHQVELTIVRKPQDQFDINSFITELQNLLQGLDMVLNNYRPEVSLIRIQKDSLVFLLNFYCNLEHINNLAYIRGVLNLALYNKIKDDEFSVEYLTVINMKNSADSAKEEKL